jgi:hypothetical protein
MTLHLSLSPVGWLVVLAFLVTGLALSGWLIRRSPYALKPVTKAALIILRGLAFATIGFLLLEPILSLVRVSRNKPVLAVVLDASQSMGTPSANLEAKARSYPPQFLSSLSDELARKFDVVSYEFSDSLRAVQKKGWAQERKPQGQRTDLGAAFSKLSSLSPEAAPSGVLLLSDGQNNYGKDPLREAQKLGVPVYAVGLGDTTRPRDIAIVRVSANEIAYDGEAIPVEVIVRNRGFAQAQTPITIREGKTTLSGQSLPLPPSGAEARINLTIPSQKEGVHRFTASIPVGEGEILKENNVRGFAVNVLRSRLRVALFASPGFELRFLKSALEQDTGLAVTTYVSPGSGRWTQVVKDAASPISFGQVLQDLPTYDLAILCDLPRDLLTDALQKSLRDVVDAKGGGLFVLGDETLKDYASLPMVQMLPVRLGGTNLEDPLEVTLTHEGENHPITTLSPDPKQNVELWKDLPPLLGANRAAGISSGATVLMVYPKVKTPQGSLPIVSCQRYGKGKVLLISGYPLWRWGFTVEGTGKGGEVYTKFLSHAVRWLGAREEGKRLKVEPLEKLVRSGESVIFTGQAYGEDNRPLDGADISVTVSEAETKKEVQKLALLSQGNGRYEGTAQLLPPGNYLFQAVGALGTQRFGEDKGEFGVEAMNLEYDQTGLNPDLLKALATATGGRYYEEAGIGSLARDIALSSQPRKTARELDLWDHPFLFFLLLLLFLAEWAIRKWVGLS